MKLLLIFFAMFALNAWYLFSFRDLMVKLEKNASVYWEKIGRPNSFSANHVGSVLLRLYTRELSEVARNAGVASTVKAVRILFPVVFILTASMLLALAHLLNLNPQT